MFTRRHRVAASLAFALSCLPLLLFTVRGEVATAGADAGADLKAKQAYARGAELYHSHKFAAAAAAFAEGNRQKPHHAFLWNLALSYRALGDHAKTIEYLQSYLKACPATATADRALAESTLADEQHRQQVASEPPPSGEPVARNKSAAAPVLVHATEDTHGKPAEQKIWRKWWFWTATGAAVAAVGLGIGLGVGLSQGSTASYREVTWQ